MVVFVATRRCAPSQPWFVYLSLPFRFIVIVIERRDNCDPNSHSSQHVNSQGSLIHHSKTWFQRLESDFRCQSFDANNQIPELGILMHTAKLHNWNVDVNNTIMLEPNIVALRHHVGTWCHCIGTQRHHIFYGFFSSIFIWISLWTNILGVPLHILLCKIRCSLQDEVM
jgi:hypothetical protein